MDALKAQLDALQSELTAARSELSEKNTQIILLQSESSHAALQLQESLATIRSLEASITRLQQQQQKSQQPQSTAASLASAEVWTQKVETAQRASAALQSQLDQTTQLYNEAVAQLEKNTAELATLRQTVSLREQECARLNALLQNAPIDANLQLNATLRLKDQRIAQLQGEIQQLQFSVQMAKRESELAAQRAQQELGELRGRVAAQSRESSELSEVRAQLSLKQQEVSRLQQQLVTEIGLVESMKSSFSQLDQMLSQRLVSNTQPVSLQAAMKALEDHNAYLQKMIATLESQNRELTAQKLKAESKLLQPLPSSSISSSLVYQQQLQLVLTALKPFFPHILLRNENAAEYVVQLGQMLKDQKSLYESLKKEWSSLQWQNSDLSQKIAVLQSYASGHDHIDQKADKFVKDVIKQRNEFEQKYKDLKVELEQKNVELEQTKRSLSNEQKTSETLRKEQKESKLPPEFSSLIEECMNICLLAKFDKSKKMNSLKDIVDTLRLVRRGLASTLNLLRRENERLDLENKRVKEMCATSKKEDDKLHSKIREIIRIVQNQGKALKEFVVAFQALQRK